MDLITKKKCCIALGLFYVHMKKKTERKRSLYMRNILKNRTHLGEMTLVKELANDPIYHFNYFRMNKTTFHEILAKVGASLSHRKSHAIPISAEERLAITLRYLAGGSSQRSIGYNFRVSPASVSNILRETMQSIWDTMSKTELPTPNMETYYEQAQEFFLKWNMPHCAGAADGKHVRIAAPGNTGSEFFNYKNYFSIVLLAVVDARYRFSIVDIGAKGSQSDNGILANSEFGKRLYTNQIDLPIPDPLPGTDIILPYFFIGDDAFPLRSNLLKPYPGKVLTTEQRIYNYRLCRARRIVENAFGIWAARFRIFHTTINADLDLADLIVKSTVVLHNFLMSKTDMGTLTVDLEKDGVLTEGNWRTINSTTTAIQDMPRCASNNFTKEAANVRDTLKNYFNSEEGNVQWQYDAINLFDK